MNGFSKFSGKYRVFFRFIPQKTFFQLGKRIIFILQPFKQMLDMQKKTFLYVFAHSFPVSDGNEKRRRRPATFTITTSFVSNELLFIIFSHSITQSCVFFGLFEANQRTFFASQFFGPTKNEHWKWKFLKFPP